MSRQTLPLRFKHVWIALGIGFVLLVIYLSLTPEPVLVDVPGGSKIGHVLAYFWLMIWFAQIYRTAGRRILLGGAFCALGVVLECLQGMTDYRHFAYTDMLIDSAGVALGFVLAWTRVQNALRSFEAALPLR